MGLGYSTTVEPTWADYERNLEQLVAVSKTLPQLQNKDASIDEHRNWNDLQLIEQAKRALKFPDLFWSYISTRTDVTVTGPFLIALAHGLISDAKWQDAPLFVLAMDSFRYGESKESLSGLQKLLNLGDPIMSVNTKAAKFVLPSGQPLYLVVLNDSHKPHRLTQNFSDCMHCWYDLKTACIFLSPTTISIFDRKALLQKRSVFTNDQHAQYRRKMWEDKGFELIPDPWPFQYKQIGSVGDSELDFFLCLMRDEAPDDSSVKDPIAVSAKAKEAVDASKKESIDASKKEPIDASRKEPIDASRKEPNSVLPQVKDVLKTFSPMVATPSSDGKEISLKDAPHKETSFLQELKEHIAKKQSHDHVVATKKTLKLLENEPPASITKDGFLYTYLTKVGTVICVVPDRYTKKQPSNATMYGFIMDCSATFIKSKRRTRQILSFIADKHETKEADVMNAISLGLAQSEIVIIGLNKLSVIPKVFLEQPTTYVVEANADFANWGMQMYLGSPGSFIGESGATQEMIIHSLQKRVESKPNSGVLQKS